MEGNGQGSVVSLPRIGDKLFLRRGHILEVLQPKSAVVLCHFFARVARELPDFGVREEIGLETTRDFPFRTFLRS